MSPRAQYSYNTSLQPTYRAPFLRWLPRRNRRERVLRFLVLVILPLAVVAVLGVLIGWFFRTKPLGEVPQGQFSGRTLFLQMALDNIDPLTAGGSITVTWTINGDTCSPYVNGTQTLDPDACPTVDIYMDANRFAGPIDPSKGPADNAAPATPLFRYNPGWQDYRGNSPTFQTALAIWNTYINTTSDSLLNYPFDKYLTEIFMYATENTTQAAPVGLRIGYSYGVGFGFDTKILQGTEISTVLGLDPASNSALYADYGAVNLWLYIRRTALVRSYVVILVGAMWLITLCLLAISFKAAFFGYNVDVSILAAPVGTLFAFTTLRAAMPGAPAAFGANIDFVGTLPSLAILILVTVVCLVHVLVSARQDESTLISREAGHSEDYSMSTMPYDSQSTKV
ncbi:hypothetical protein PsYK624_077030 [Phanerochaete sordida]|uniref:Uncharacterized protein n=1 Tax=Phanerochaete sordida TaxID=48140 RepID=A0A9P3GAX8_9APHY|nr:hypothetical protein PsYK624_077030 [Phanerochaete sordida]